MIPLDMGQGEHASWALEFKGKGPVRSRRLSDTMLGASYLRVAPHVNREPETIT